jgi:AbrB family looped-hinge helix DNA binding protein
MHNFKFCGSAKIGSKGQVVIPADAREEFRLNEGDKVVIMKAPMHEGLMVLKAEVLMSRV